MAAASGADRALPVAAARAAEYNGESELITTIATRLSGHDSEQHENHASDSQPDLETAGDLGVIGFDGRFQFGLLSPRWK